MALEYLVIVPALKLLVGTEDLEAPIEYDPGPDLEYGVHKPRTAYEREQCSGLAHTLFEGFDWRMQDENSADIHALLEEGYWFWQGPRGALWAGMTLVRRHQLHASR
jgi:hypothetical protein